MFLGSRLGLDLTRRSRGGSAAATAPEIDVTVNAVAQADNSTFEPPDPVIGTLVQYVVEVTNNGDAQLDIVNATRSGAVTAVTAWNDTTIAPAGTATCTITLDTATSGAQTGYFEFTTNDLTDNEDTYRVNVSYTVLEEEFLVFVRDAMGADRWYRGKQTAGTNEPNAVAPGTNDGTISNVTLGQAGADSAANEAYDFNGSNSQISTPAGADINGALPQSWIFIINPDQILNASTIANLVSKGGDSDFQIRLTTTTTPLRVSTRWAFSGGLLNVGQNSMIALDTWTALLVRLNPTKTVTLMKNDEARIDIATAGSGTKTSTTDPAVIGFLTGNPYDGLIDEVVFKSGMIYQGDFISFAIERGIVAPYAGNAVRYNWEKLSATTINPDGLDIADIFGNGRDDVITARSTVTPGAYAYRQNADETWTEFIIGSHGTNLEGCCAGDFDGDGNIEIVTLDQEEGVIRIYKNGGAPTTVPWTMGQILTGRDGLQDCRAWDTDGDGLPEIVYTFEGVDASDGGLHQLDWNSGDVASAASWTDYVMVQHPGAWAIASTRVDLAGNGRGDIVFSGRDSRNNAPTTGVYWAEEPAVPTNPWTRHTVDNRAGDWVHLDVGDFFGNGHGKDIVATEHDDDAIAPALYDFSNAWARTDLSVPSSTVKRFACNTLSRASGRDWLYIAFETLGLFVYQYTGGAWTYYKVENLPATHAHPFDRKFKFGTYAGRDVAFACDSGGGKIMWLELPE